MSDPVNGPYGPSVFFADYDLPPGGTVVIPPLPRSDGGPIQSVKAAILEGLSASLQNSTLFSKGQKVYIDLDYPLVPEKYPGIWVQFALTKLNRAGLGHEIPVEDGHGNWSFIQEMTFTGTVTLTIAALSSRDRDKLADSMIMLLSFARTPQLLITKPQADTKQFRSLITALDENPYVAITINTDTITLGGQQASMGVPWANNELTYEDSYSFDMVGQFNTSLSNDGLYTLARIDPNIQMDPQTLMDQAPAYNPVLWADQPVHGPYGSGPGFGGQQNPANVDFPGM